MDLKTSGWFLCFSYLDRRFCTKSFFRSPVDASAKVVLKIPLWGNGRMMDIVMEQPPAEARPIRCHYVTSNFEAPTLFS